MIYDIRRKRVHTEHGWVDELQVKRTASADWEDVRVEHVDENNRALPMNDEVRSLS